MGRSRSRLTAPQLCSLFAALVLTGGPASADDAPLIAVAANMTAAMETIAARFETLAGVRVRLSVGASGNLARQIQRGAPFELFIAADDGYPRRVAQAGFARSPPVLYAEGRLDLLLPAPTVVSVDAAANDEARLRATLASSAIRRLALANPEHAPYGRAARQVLEALGYWSEYQGRLVLGESVSQAARFATTGAVQAAFLPRSLAQGSVFKQALRLAVPGRLHDPIHQHMVLLNGAGPGASNLFDFMLSDAAREVLASHGYALPARN